MDAINPSNLKVREELARYALLKSMALDKNYVDTTSFDILQPAIDYYSENGTPNEKFRMFYYIFGKEVGEYIKLKRHYNVSSEIRKNLG